MIASDNTHDHAGHDHQHGQGHQHGHGHGGHGHSHAPSSFGRAFAIGTALNLTFVVVEAVYGLIAGSMALLADAGHNLSDVLGLLIAWSAMALARRKPSGRYTYGLRSSSILAALFNRQAPFDDAHLDEWARHLDATNTESNGDGTLPIPAIHSLYRGEGA